MLFIEFFPSSRDLFASFLEEHRAYQTAILHDLQNGSEIRDLCKKIGEALLILKRKLKVRVILDISYFINGASLITNETIELSLEKTRRWPIFIIFPSDRELLLRCLEVELDGLSNDPGSFLDNLSVATEPDFYLEEKIKRTIKMLEGECGVEIFCSIEWYKNEELVGVVDGIKICTQQQL